MSDLNLKFLTDFELFMQNRNKMATRACNRNAISNHIIRIRTITFLALRNDWLDKDPFAKFKLSFVPTKREFLSTNELQLIENSSFTNPLLELVKDLFIFSCYTGLAYVDLSNLTHDNLSVGIDKEMWINTSRAKTDVSFKLPVLPKAAEIIKKYEKSHFCKIENGVLPILTNANVNWNLKVIAKTCGINKNLTFHMARHTFATSVTLTNGVPIETVSKMMGHTSIRTTQIYAKVVDSKISNDMQILRQKLVIQNMSEKLVKTAN